MRLGLLGLILLFLFSLAIAQVRQVSTIDTLYEHSLPVSQLAEVTDWHGCARQQAFLEVSETEKQLTIRVSLIENGTETTIFETTHLPSSYPTGNTYTYTPPKQGEYALIVIYPAEASKRRTFTIDCTYGQEAPAAPETPSTLPETPPSPAPASTGAVDAGELAANESAAAGPGAPTVIPAEQFEEETAAYNMMGNALHAIDSARSYGADVALADERLEQARTAYSEGEYALALQLAEEAVSLAEQSVSPPAEPEEQPAAEEGGFTLPSIDSSLLPILGGALLLALVIYFLLKRRAEEPPEELAPEQLPSSRRPHMTSKTSPEEEESPAAPPERRSPPPAPPSVPPRSPPSEPTS